MSKIKISLIIILIFNSYKILHATDNTSSHSNQDPYDYDSISTFTVIPCVHDFSPIPTIDNALATHPIYMCHKKAIIIGASSDITRNLISLLTADGYLIGVIDGEERTLQQIQYDTPSMLFTKKITHSNVTQITSLFNELVYEMNGLDLMIITNNIWPELKAHTQNGLLLPNNTINLEYERNTITVNITNFVTIANAALNYFIKKGSGHLVGITSLDVFSGNAACPTYSASKAFSSIYLQGMRKRLNQLNIPITITEIRREWSTIKNYITNQYWTIPADQAAKTIRNAIAHKQNTAYITQQWWPIAVLRKLIPNWFSF
ncbi:MAG TPA: SDR family NAD(P)-dependent oxidoreductase [Candidatus Babeliales bacterium]|nr:SDR family NAD(P)-dependent oxidoreductase [Candidatus Babeliales bacterium]